MITDEMIEQGARALFGDAQGFASTSDDVRAHYLGLSRTVLEAVLGDESGE